MIVASFFWLCQIAVAFGSPPQWRTSNGQTFVVDAANGTVTLTFHGTKGDIVFRGPGTAKAFLATVVSGPCGQCNMAPDILAQAKATGLYQPQRFEGELIAPNHLRLTLLSNVVYWWNKTRKVQRVAPTTAVTYDVFSQSPEISTFHSGRTVASKSTEAVLYAFHGAQLYSATTRLNYSFQCERIKDGERGTTSAWHLTLQNSMMHAAQNLTVRLSNPSDSGKIATEEAFLHPAASNGKANLDFPSFDMPCDGVHLPVLFVATKPGVFIRVPSSKSDAVGSRG